MREILLTQGYVALVDDEDFNLVSKFKWHVAIRRRTNYAGCTLPNKDHLLMHRLLLPDSIEVAHRDGNGLNNQRHNIRPCTPSQNRRGIQSKALGKTSIYRGVHWDLARGVWKTEIKINGQKKFVGRFKIEREAAVAYNEAAIFFFGEDASPNKL